MRIIISIWKKQQKETLRNKTILLPFLLFPFIAFIMNQSVHMEGMPKHFFIYLFSIMYITMAPISVIAAILAEEKEHHTFEIMAMAKVNVYQYLTAILSHTLLICMIGAMTFVWMGDFTITEMIRFLFLMGMGCLISLLIGVIIGTWSTSTIMANSLSIPIMMIFSFLPMLAMFNETIQKIARFSYTYIIHTMMLHLDQMTWEPFSLVILILTTSIAVILFVLAYRSAPLL